MALVKNIVDTHILILTWPRKVLITNNIKKANKAKMEKGSKKRETIY